MSGSSISSCCSSMSIPSAFCHAPMHVHPSPSLLQRQMHADRILIPSASLSRSIFYSIEGSPRITNFKQEIRSSSSNTNLWRRMSRPGKGDDFMDDSDGYEEQDQEQRFVYDLEDEETLLELLALEDLDELEDDDLDVINLNDLEELKDLEQILNQRGKGWGDDDDDDDDLDSDIDIGMEPDEMNMAYDIEDEEDKSIINSSKQTITSASTLPTSVAKDTPEPITATMPSSQSALEQALMQGVVPAAAGVGSNCLPGDYGFDPLGLATKDYFKKAQTIILNLLPASKVEEKNIKQDPGAALPRTKSPKYYDDEERPPALILRDYREIEIRHGRLAMLAALLWPLQEITDRLFIPNVFGKTTMVYGGVTLPFVSLFMTLVMLLLGYLDIYAASIKENDAGDAFLPGECFWDPLRILDGTSESVKRNMQARELNNGRFAMVAVLSYILQEGITHQPLITLPWNQVLFEPAFEIPAVQAWLDAQFSGAITGKGVMLIEQERVLEGGEVVKMIIIEDPSTAASATAEVGLGVGTDSVDMDALKDGVEATMDTVTD